MVWFSQMMHNTIIMIFCQTGKLLIGLHFYRFKYFYFTQLYYYIVYPFTIDGFSGCSFIKSKHVLICTLIISTYSSICIFLYCSHRVIMLFYDTNLHVLFNNLMFFYLDLSFFYDFQLNLSIMSTTLLNCSVLNLILPTWLSVSFVLKECKYQLFYSYTRAKFH